MSNKAYFGGLLLTSNENLEGEKIVSLSLDYNGDGSIQHDFADVVLENVAVGNDEEESISMIGVSSISDDNGVFQNLSINEGEHEFHLDKAAQFNPQAINSYDAYLALKISMLIDISSLNLEIFISEINSFLQKSVSTCMWVHNQSKSVPESLDVCSAGIQSQFRNEFRR